MPKINDLIVSLTQNVFHCDQQLDCCLIVKELIEKCSILQLFYRPSFLAVMAVVLQPCTSKCKQTKTTKMAVWFQIEM